jgi:hypothetical protein
MSNVKEILLRITMTGILAVPYHIKKTHKSVKKHIGLAEVFFMLRRGFSEIVSFIISPLLILKFDFGIATFFIFIITLVIALLFLFISDLFKSDTFQIEMLKLEMGINKKIMDKPGIIIKILRFLYKTGKYLKVGKSILYTFALCLEPLYLTLLIRKGHHRYNGIPDIETFIMFLLSSVTSAVLWSMFLFFMKPYIMVMIYSAILLTLSWIVIRFIIRKF